MADWADPKITSNYVSVIANLRDKDIDSATMFKTNPTNHPTGSIRWNRATFLFEEWDGAVWQPLATSVAGGGTGGATQAAARTNLGLGTMAVQNGDNVNITGGAIGGSVGINGVNISSGLIPAARLGTGTPSADVFLAGDQVWRSAVPIGGGAFWFTNVAPAGWLFPDGALINRVTYAALFALWGTKYGVGDGSTTFKMPDMRGYYPFIKAAAGTGSALDSTFGTLDHTHTLASHNHTGPAHIHTISSSGTHHHGYGAHHHGQNTSVLVSFGVDIYVCGAGNTNDTTLGNSSDDGDHNHGGNTGSAGTGVTGDSGILTTGGANPPSFVCNIIIRAL